MASVLLKLASEDCNEKPYLEAEGSEEALQLSEAPNRKNLECVTAEGRVADATGRATGKCSLKGNWRKGTTPRRLNSWPML